MRRAAQVATAYRKYQDHLPPGGYVLLWRMKGTGWTRDLSDPSRCRPGALAVGAAGDVHMATKGDYWGGADEWTAIYEPARATA